MVIPSGSRRAFWPPFWAWVISTPATSLACCAAAIRAATLLIGCNLLQFFKVLFQLVTRCGDDRPVFLHDRPIVQHSGMPVNLLVHARAELNGGRERYIQIV